MKLQDTGIEWNLSLETCDQSCLISIHPFILTFSPLVLILWKLVNVLTRKFVSTNWSRRVLAQCHAIIHSVMNQTYHSACLWGWLLPYYSTIICSYCQPSIFFFCWQHILRPVRYQCWAIITGSMCHQQWNYLSGIICKNIKIVE